MDKNKSGESLDPKLAVIDEISSRLKQNTTDVPSRMRIDLLVGDIVQTVTTSEKSNEELLEEVKTTQGYLGANTVFHIEDSTIEILINEAKEKLETKQI